MDNPQLTRKAYHFEVFVLAYIQRSTMCVCVCVVQGLVSFFLLIKKKMRRRDFLTDYRCQVGKLPRLPAVDLFEIILQYKLGALAPQIIIPQ